MIACSSVKPFASRGFVALLAVLLLVAPVRGDVCGTTTPQIGPPINNPPGSVPGIDFTVRCIQRRCTFVAASFQQPIEADIRSYSWNFADGVTGAGGFNVHEFVWSEPVSEKTFAVTLAVTFDSGAFTQTTKNVLVRDIAAEADFAYRPTQLGWGPAPIDSDGNPLGLSIDHIGQLLNSHPGRTYYWFWYFGDGGDAQGRQATHYYVTPGTYIARLEVNEVDDHTGQLTGRSVKELQIVVKNRPPVPDFTTTCTPDGCTFNAAPSLDDGQGASGIRSWSWDFGDGSFATGAQAAHAFARGARPYSVTLSATDGMSATASIVKTVTPADRRPVAAFDFNCAALSCKFDASPTTDDNGVNGYTWNFGDGTAAGLTTARTFPADGRYGVTLTVTDTAGNSAVVPRNVSVTSAGVGEPQRFIPIAPCRIFDTRSADAPALASGVERQISLASGGCGLPPGAASVAVNATVVPSPTSGDGFLQLGPAGRTLETSVLNFTRDRIPRGNNTIVQLNRGSIRAMAYASGGGNVDLILDVSGFFTSDLAFQKGLLFAALPPCRLIDTGETPPGLTSAEPRTVVVGGERCGVPATAEAAALNLGVTSASGAGNLRLYPGDIAPPLISSLNFQPSTIPQANGAIAGMSLDSLRSVRVKLDAAASADIVLDTTGYFQSGAPLAFHPIFPCRAVNTLDTGGGEPRLTSGARRSFQIRGNCGVPLEARAAVLNLTVVGPDGTGSLTAYPADMEDPPLTPTVLFTAGEFGIGNNVILPLAQTPRDLSVMPLLATGQGLNLVVDVVGYFSPVPVFGR